MLMVEDINVLIDLVFIPKGQKELFTAMKNTMEYHKLGKINKNNFMCTSNNFVSLLKGVLETYTRDKDYTFDVQFQFLAIPYISKYKLVYVRLLNE